MSTPNSNPPNSTEGTDSSATFSNPLPPKDSTLFGGGYDANNAIFAGENNIIKNSRGCSIVQGYSNKIENKFNIKVS